MKLIIAGSRSLSGKSNSIYKYLNEIEKSNNIEEVVSGTARGPDTIGENWADDNNIPVKRFPANWNKHGKSAGFKRNVEMAEYADALIAFWDGESNGTKHMINTAQSKDLKVKVIKLSK